MSAASQGSWRMRARDACCVKLSVSDRLFYSSLDPRDGMIYLKSLRR